MLDELQVWFSVNRLSLNVMKTNYMFFGIRKLTVDISVKVNKETINRVNVKKNVLGVKIDDKLNWKNQNFQRAVLYRAIFLIDRRGMHIL